MLNKIYRGLLYALPVALYFSYFPVISFGGDATMNFELSLPLIWLVMFDVVVMVIITQEKRWRGIFCALKRKWVAFLFPIFVSLSVAWSLNVVRGVLTVGVMWAITLAVVATYFLRDIVDAKLSRRWFKVFFAAALGVCIWCVIQCVLDLAGVSRGWTLLCEGCTYRSFGFPHPNGFAIEPQFMGNLLLAPAVVAGWLIIKQNNKNLKWEHSRLLFCFFVFATTLFLTFSRGAIYAFMVAMIFMTALVLVQKRAMLKRALMMWGAVILSFAFALNLQGVMTAVSPTNDTYFDGVARALNHLSLGVIDVRGAITEVDNGEKSEGTQALGSGEVTEEMQAPILGEEAIFDGYVEESTEVRKELTRNGLAVWRRDLKTVFIGVGIGGAGEAMYANGLTGSPKEIIQNEYVSLLAETGAVGVMLAVILLVLMVRFVVLKNRNTASVMLTLLVAYGITLLFFSGLANALQIYLLPMVIMICLNNQTGFLKKLVS